MVKREGFTIVTADGQLSHSNDYCEFFIGEESAEDRKEEIEANISFTEKFKVVKATLTYDE